MNACRKLVNPSRLAIALLGAAAVLAPVRAIAQDCDTKIAIVDGELKTALHATEVDPTNLNRYVSQVDAAIQSAKIWCRDDAAAMELLQMRERGLMEVRAVLRGDKLPDDAQERVAKRENLKKCADINPRLTVVLQAHEEPNRSGNSQLIAESFRRIQEVVRDGLKVCTDAPKMMSQLREMDKNLTIKIVELERSSGGK